MRAALSLLLVVAALPAAAQALAPAELAQMLATVASSSGSFIETKHSALLKEPLVTQGTLAYRRPAMLEKHVRQPYDERTLLEGDSLTIDNRARGHGLTVSVAASPQFAALIEGIRAVRAGDLATLERYFEISVEGRRERWSMVLKPSAGQVAGYVARIVVSGAESRIARIEVEETSGDRSVMDIREESR